MVLSCPPTKGICQLSLIQRRDLRPREVTLPARSSAGWGGRAVPSPGRKELAGHVCFPSYLPPPNPGAHPSAYSTRPITQRLQFPVPTDVCRQHLWVGYQPDLGVGTDLCLSVSQAGTPTTGQVLCLGHSPAGTALAVEAAPPRVLGRVGKVTSLPGPCCLLQRLSFIL